MRKKASKPHDVTKQNDTFRGEATVPDATDINTTKTKLHRLLQSATPQPVTETPVTHGMVLPTLLIICLIGTMVPFQTAMSFFSLAAVIAALLLLVSTIWLRHKINKHITVLIAALTLSSLLSGCSPAFSLAVPPEVLQMAQENGFKVHTLRKIGIFGLGLDQATVQTAMAESNIEQVRAIQIDRGHGLISVVTITIAGEV
jgi:hypothetical protein